MRKSDLVCVGAIAGAFGVKGEVRLKSFCSEPSDIASYGALSSDKGERSFSITLTRPLKNGYAARLSGVANREEAEGLKGVRLYAPRAALPSLPDDEFYHADLIGLLAVDTGGAEIGKVAAVLNHGAGDLLELRGPGLGNGVLVPFTEAAVPTVDLTAKRVIVDPPSGLLPGSDDPGSDDTDEPS